MDSKFTKKLGEWLKKDSAERDTLEGAMLLLQLTGNRLQYSAILTNPTKYAGFVSYQLQKHYNFRVADLTLAELDDLSKKASEQAAAIGIDENEDSASEQAAAFSGYGRRPDHAYLPEEYKKLYEDNLEIRRKMQQLHLQIRTKYREITNCSASDVYALVVELLRYEKIYNDNWAKYDGLKPVASKS